MKEKPIAQTDAWRADYLTSREMLESARNGSKRQFVIPVEDVHELWRLLSKLNGYVKSPPLQPGLFVVISKK